MTSNKEYENDIFFSLIRKVPKHIWICFISGVVAGLITHLYMLMNKLPNWDEINNISGSGSGDSWGRWFLKYVRPLSGQWSVPAINGTLTIVIIAIASCFIMLALNLKSITSAVLLPIMAVTFPGLTSIMTFMFTANSYAMGILLVSIGVFLLRKVRYGFVFAPVLLLCGLGIYQSYICLAAGILVLGLVLDLIENYDLKKIIRQGFLYLGVLGSSMLGYLLISKSTTTLTESQGISDMGQIELIMIPRLIMRCYKRILEYFITEPLSFVSNEMWYLNIATCIAGILLLAVVIKQRRLYRDKIKTFFIIFVAMLVPLSLASIYLLAPNTQDAAMTMLYQYFMIYVVVIAFIEKTSFTQGKIIRILCQLTIVVVLLVGYHNYLIANEAYFRMGMAYERVSAYYNRIVARIEEQPDYQYGDKLLILGNAYPDRYAVAAHDMQDERFDEFSGVATENGMLTEGVRINFLRVYLGLEIPGVELDEIEDLKAKKEYREMAVYPKEGSIQEIDGIWIVKIYEEAAKN